jgi:adenosylmethionine-8-amino-7-oxononanoate aminotransferase
VTQVFYRDPRGAMRRVAGGKGIELWDEVGGRYLDASGGAAVSCIGHGHPEVIEAMHRQAERIAYAHTGFFTSEPAEDLAELLAASAPALPHVYFLSGGSEGVEAALKLARQYHIERGQPARSRFIARRQSYHGNTLGALSVGGNMFRRAPFEPILIETSHVSPCFPYRFQERDETDQDYVARLVRELDDTIRDLGPDTVAAFVAETVVGATSGAVTALPGYFAGIRKVCDRHGVLLILDEVMCGMGRTGSLHAFEQEGIVPDLLVIAKGLGGGYQPIGAVMASDPVYQAIVGGTGYFQHGHTYMAHPMACAAALAVQQVIRRDGLVMAAREQGRYLAARLRGRFGNHPHVGDIRGRGLFQAVELVADRGSTAPFDPEARLHAQVKQAALASGLIVYPMGGTIDGRLGDHVLLAPPFNVTQSEIDEIVERLGNAVDAAIGEANAGPAPGFSGAHNVRL